MGKILNGPFFAYSTCTSIIHIDSKHSGIYKSPTPFLKAETGRLHWESIRCRALGYLGLNTNFSTYSLAAGPWASYLCSITIHIS